MQPKNEEKASKVQITVNSKVTVSPVIKVSFPIIVTTNVLGSLTSVIRGFSNVIRKKQQ